MSATHTITADQHAALTDALDALAHLDTASDLGPHLTCPEADALIRFLQAFGEETAAEAMLQGHADSDDEGDEHYTGED